MTEDEARLLRSVCRWRRATNTREQLRIDPLASWVGDRRFIVGHPWQGGVPQYRGNDVPNPGTRISITEAALWALAWDRSTRNHEVYGAHADTALLPALSLPMTFENTLPQNLYGDVDWKCGDSTGRSYKGSVRDLARAKLGMMTDRLQSEGDPLGQWLALTMIEQRKEQVPGTYRDIEPNELCAELDRVTATRDIAVRQIHIQQLLGTHQIAGGWTWFVDKCAAHCVQTTDGVLLNLIDTHRWFPNQTRAIDDCSRSWRPQLYSVHVRSVDAHAQATGAIHHLQIGLRGSLSAMDTLRVERITNLAGLLLEINIPAVSL